MAGHRFGFTGSRAIGSSGDLSVPGARTEMDERTSTPDTRASLDPRGPVLKINSLRQFSVWQERKCSVVSVHVDDGLRAGSTLLLVKLPTSRLESLKSPFRLLVSKT